MKVGRPREFDQEQVLEAAMEIFWRKGFEATSVADLVSATGLHKGSLYKAFGDKHALFCASLRNYMQQMHIIFREKVASEPSPSAGLHKALHGMMDVGLAEGECRGCMAVNTMVERGGCDTDAQEILGRAFQTYMTLLADTVVKAQRLGELHTERSPELVAVLIGTFMSGLSSGIKGPLTEAQGRLALDEQLRLLGFQWS